MVFHFSAYGPTLGLQNMACLLSGLRLRCDVSILICNAPLAYLFQFRRHCLPAPALFLNLQTWFINHLLEKAGDEST